MRTNSRISVSEAQREVWEWKEDAWGEVAHLDLAAAVRKRLHDSAKTASDLGFSPTTDRKGPILPGGNPPAVGK
jgi:hypothetical protein